jgi:hypothetical protein
VVVAAEEVKREDNDRTQGESQVVAVKVEEIGVEQVKEIIE